MLGDTSKTITLTSHAPIEGYRYPFHHTVCSSENWDSNKTRKVVDEVGTSHVLLMKYFGCRSDVVGILEFL